MGSKFFDPSLIEPVKKKSLSCKYLLYEDAPLNLQQNSSYIVPEEKTSVTKAKAGTLNDTPKVHRFLYLG